MSKPDQLHIIPTVLIFSVQKNHTIHSALAPEFGMQERLRNRVRTWPRMGRSEIKPVEPYMEAETTHCSLGALPPSSSHQGGWRRIWRTAEVSEDREQLSGHRGGRPSSCQPHLKLEINLMETKNTETVCTQSEKKGTKLQTQFAPPSHRITDRTFRAATLSAAVASSQPTQHAATHMTLTPQKDNAVPSPNTTDVFASSK